MRLILVGGGLANSLIGYRLATMRPDVDWTILESGAELGGNHTWSFHAGDLTPDQQAWMDPFVSARWPGYTVSFPGLDRRLPLGYRSVSADQMRAVMAAQAGRIRTGAAVAALRPDGVTLGSGEEIRADAVIDGRGYRPSPHLQIAFQKFYGAEVRTAAPHGQADPVIMDATVPQRDGFRFVYTLPFAPDRVLVEDTYYSDDRALDPGALRGETLDYARHRGWRVAEVLREEDTPGTNAPAAVTAEGEVADEEEEEGGHADEAESLGLLVPNVELSTGSTPAHIPGNAPSAAAQTLITRLRSLL